MTGGPLRFAAKYGIHGALALLVLFFALTLPGVFLTEGNLFNVLRQNSFTAVLAAGMTLTILTGGIDLSVGSVVALAGVLAADAASRTGSVLAGIVAGVAAGAATGAVNGLLATRVRIAPFIATLATMLIVRGVSNKYTEARTVVLPEELRVPFGALADGVVPVLLMLAVLVLVHGLLVRTPFGRHVYAVGGNAEAARLAGIRVPRVLLGVYVLCGTLAGLGGVIVASRLGSGDPRAGLFYELDAVTAAVVGGTSLTGGRGTVQGTLAGAFFIGVLNNGMNLHGVQTYDQQIVKGLVLLGAASLDLWRGRDR